MKSEKEIQQVIDNLFQQCREAYKKGNKNYAMVCLEKAGILTWVIKDMKIGDPEFIKMLDSPGIKKFVEECRKKFG